MRRGHQPSIRYCSRFGFTLLEVLLATAILSLSLAAVGQLATNGRNAALRTELDSRAAMMCQSTMDGILIGSRLPGQVVSPDWIVNATVTEGPTPTLDRVTVRVESKRGAARSSFELMRLRPKSGVRR